MVIIMKKYLFLLLLFVFYLILVTKREVTTPTFSISDDTNSVKTVIIEFENGINSKNLVSDFNINKDYYLVKNIELEDEKYNVNCIKIDECIKNIYEQEDNAFNTKYIASGFKIKSITYLIYDSFNSDKLYDNSVIYVNK